MSEEIIINSNAAAQQTDKPDVFQTIKDHIESDAAFEYMRGDGGRLQVVSFLKDVLTLALQGSCVTCKVTEGTKRGIIANLEDMFPEIEVKFQNPSKPGAAPAFAFAPA